MAATLVALSSSSTSITSLGDRGTSKVVTAHKQREGGGFVVRRPFPSSGIDTVAGGLFLMLDHLGPITYGPGEAVGAPDHPHRGFCTVTYILQGELEHLDSDGSSGKLKAGSVSWMTAGRGVVHSEMPSKEFTERGGVNEGFQLWVNLPAKDKMIAPRYQDYDADMIPIVLVGSSNIGAAAAVAAAASTSTSSTSSSISLGAGYMPSQVRVIAGNFNGQQGVVETHTPTSYMDVRLNAGDSILAPIPEGHEGFVYVYQGSGIFGKSLTPAREGSMVLIGNMTTTSANNIATSSTGSDGSVETTTPEATSPTFRIAASSDESMRCLLIFGKPLNEPVARYGPFVMNTMQEIKQAIADYQSGRMGAIEGSDDRYAATQASKSKQQETGKWQKDSKEL